MADNKFELTKYSDLEGTAKDLEVVPMYPRMPGPADWASYGGDGDGEDKIHFREYWRRIRRHKWLILSTVVIVTTLVTIQAYRVKEWYIASSVLEIGKENSVILRTGDITVNDGSDSSNAVALNTKMLAFENPELYIQAAKDLNLDQNAVVKDKVSQKPIISSARLLDLVGLSRNSPPQNSPTPPPSYDPAAEEISRFGPYASYIRNSMVVEQLKSTQAIKLSFTDEDPMLAANITNTVAGIFRQQSFDKQTEKFTNSVNWLDTSTRELRAKVQAAEEALTNYTRENQIYSTAGTGTGGAEKEPTLTTTSLVQLHGQFVKAQTEQLLKKSLYEQVQTGHVADLPEAFSDPRINAAQLQLAALQTQAAALKVKFGPTNPKTVEIQNQIEVLTSQIEKSRTNLETKLRAEYERSVKDVGSLNTALNTAKAAAVNENQAAIKFNILKQDVDTARTMYTDFLQKTNQAKLQVAEQDNNIKVIQPASAPGGPAGPRRLNIILTGFILSLGAGIGLALFLEYLDNTIKTLDDVEQYAQLPTLGVIPSIATTSVGFLKGMGKAKQALLAKNESLLILDAPQNAAQLKLLANLDNSSINGEAYRALRTSLLLSAAGTPPKSILVTSGQAGEGKTTTAVNTAISLSQLGAKVLLIDCDLRRPSVHKQLDVSNLDGVTNYLSSNTELEPLVKPSDIPNLSVMTCGPIPPNPAELLSSRKMKQMLEILGQSFDHIIIDSPPIVNVTDPVILSTLVDGTVMVIQGGKTTRDFVQRSRQELLSVRAKIFGVVLNNVNLHKEGYEYYYYYRYSNYYRSHTDKQNNN